METKKYIIEVKQDSDDDESDELYYYIKGVIVDRVFIEPVEDEQ